MEQFQKKKDREKTSENEQHNQLYSAYDSMYKDNLTNLQEKHKSETKQLRDNVKELKDQVKEHKEKASELARELKNKTKSYENDLNKLKDSESKCKEELRITTMNFTTNIESLTKDIETIKESTSEKINALEAQVKTLLNEKSDLNIKVFSLESMHKIQIESRDQQIDSLKTDIEILKKKTDNVSVDKTRAYNKFKKGAYGAERSSSNFSKNNLRPSYSKFQPGYGKGQSSTGSSMCGSQKENNSGTMPFGGDFISKTLGKTTNFDQLSTNKASVPLGRNLNQNNTTLSQYESRDDEE